MNIISGKQNTNNRIVMYGPEGIGKSTFGQQFPKAIFVDFEGSTEDMDVERINPITWGEALAALTMFAKDNQGYDNLIIDTADWAQKMAVHSICAKNNWDTISQKNDYGYSYNLLGEAWGKFVNKLTDVSKKMNVIVLCHSHLTKFEQPDENGTYDRWSLKLICTPKYDMSAMLKEWAKMVLFVNYKVDVVEINNKKKAQGGKRVMYTTHSPCWDAKNRFDLPIQLPFEIDAKGVHTGYENLKTILAEQAGIPSVPIDGGIRAKEHIDTPGSTTVSENQVIPLKEDPTSFPAQLWDLMTLHGVQEEEIQKVVAAQGYYPESTPVGSYDKSFVDGRLIEHWDAVYNEIKKIRK